MTPEPLLVRIVVVTVAAAWTFALVASILSHDYQGLIYTSPPMGLVVGYATGVKILRKVNGG